MTKKWKWKDVTPPKFDIGQRVWVVRSSIIISTGEDWVEDGIVSRIDIELYKGCTNYSYWVCNALGNSIGIYHFDGIYRIKKEAMKECSIRNKEWALRKLEGEVHEAKVSLEGFKKYSKGALEAAIKELEELVKNKTKELKELKEDKNEKS